MELIDSHCHLNAKQFDHDRDIVVQKAIDSGISVILDSGETFDENEKSLFISVKYPIVKSCAGFSPKNLKQADAKMVQDQMRLNKDKITAIGEVGLDYWFVKGHMERETQKKIFESFIKLAIELNKPLVIHSRSAGRQCIELLEKNGAKHVCMHAFDGAAESAKRGVELGYFFSIPPSINFSPQKQHLVQALPIENLLLESDAPALGPSHGSRNEPKNITVALEEIARVKKVTKEQVAKITTQNAKKLFGI